MERTLAFAEDHKSARTQVLHKPVAPPTCDSLFRCPSASWKASLQLQFHRSIDRNAHHSSLFVSPAVGGKNTVLLGMKLLNLDCGMFFNAGRRWNLRFFRGHRIRTRAGRGMRFQVMEDAVNNQADDRDCNCESGASQKDRRNPGISRFVACPVLLRSSLHTQNATVSRGAPCKRGSPKGTRGRDFSCQKNTASQRPPTANGVTKSIQ